MSESVVFEAITQRALDDGIVGGFCRRLVDQAVESFVDDANIGNVSTFDCFEICRKSEDADEWFKELRDSYDSLESLIGAVAQRCFYSDVYADTHEELKQIEDLCDELEADGYNVEVIGTGSCALGWLPHQTEEDYGSDDLTGSLCYWRQPEGGPDAWVLYFNLEGGRVWFRLSKEAEELSDVA